MLRLELFYGAVTLGRSASQKISDSYKFLGGKESAPPVTSDEGGGRPEGSEAWKPGWGSSVGPIVIPQKKGMGVSVLCQCR